MNAERALEFLCAFHDDRKGSKISPQATTYFLQYLGSLTPEDVRDTVVKHAVERFPRFPTIQQLRGVAVEVLGARKQDEDRRRKREAVVARERLEPDADPKHAAEAFALILRIQRGELRGPARVHALEDMARRFPGRWPDADGKHPVGWEDAVQDARASLVARTPEERARIAGRVIPDAAARIRRCAEALPRLYDRRLAGYRGSSS